MATAAFPTVGPVRTEQTNRSPVLIVRPEPTMARTMVRSMAATSVAMFVLTGVPLWLFTGNVWDGIGLGAFCGFWGGPGFGAMIGGTLWTMGQERDHREDREGKPKTGSSR